MTDMVALLIIPIVISFVQNLSTQRDTCSICWRLEPKEPEIQ